MDDIYCPCITSHLNIIFISPRLRISLSLTISAYVSVCLCVCADLKPDNIGFTSDGTLKLFDFGLCTCVKATSTDETVYEMTGNTGSLRYMAPEVAMRRAYNEKVDVYSYGIMVWQMARDRVPFKGLSKIEFFSTVVNGDNRPPLDRAWPTRFSTLLKSCWHRDYKKRPSFEDIVVELDKLIFEAGGKSLHVTPGGTPPMPKDKDEGGGAFHSSGGSPPIINKSPTPPLIQAAVSSFRFSRSAQPSPALPSSSQSPSPGLPNLPNSYGPNSYGANPNGNTNAPFDYPSHAAAVNATGGSGSGSGQGGLTGILDKLWGNKGGDGHTI